jgi:predicted membrane-bound spermidine synthase
MNGERNVQLLGGGNGIAKRKMRERVATLIDEL